jgi:hypothetical protein
VHGLNSFESFHPSSQHGEPVARPDYVAGPVVAEGESVQSDAAEGGGTLRGPRTPELAPVSEGTPVITSAPTNFFQPIDLYDAGGYDYQALNALGHCCNPLGNPGQSPIQTTIAIAAYGDVAFSDVTGYQAGFPYLAYNIQKWYIDGTYKCNNTSKGPDVNCVETTLDTEWSLSMSNSFGSYASTAKLVLYEGVNSNSSTIVDVYNQILDDNSTRIMSTSWGCQETKGCSNSSMKSIDNVLSALAGQGWTIVGDSGDNGATAGCGTTLGVQFPASDPNVLGVGGTALQVYSNTLGFVSEVAWSGSTAKGSCSQNNGGSTGGFSSYFAVPGFQSGMGFTKRSVPDMALNASTGQDTYFNGGWISTNGTSIATPELAGFFAQENAYLLSLGNICGGNNNSPCAPLGNPNYAIYNQGNHPNGAHVPFYDITSGCNSNDITVANKLTAYCAKTGFDQVTGWGSANMLQLAWAINWETLPANGIPYTSFSGPATGKWINTSQNVNFTIQDYAGTTGGKPTGIAGYTAGWDSIPADPSTEATPAANISTANSFYSGPQVANVRTGSSSLQQGCHTLHVRGWNNMGWTTGDSTYGSVCFDSVAPGVSASVTGSESISGWYLSNVTVTLSANDLTSGVAAVYYSVNSSACATQATSYCTLYRSPFTVSAQGADRVYFFAKDNAGNFSAMQTQTIDLDDVPPVTTLALSGTPYGAGYSGPVTLTLHATDAASGVRYTYLGIDAAYPTPVAAPVTVSAAGAHTVTFYSLDVAGNLEAHHTSTFTIAPSSTTTLSVSANPAYTTQPLVLSATVVDEINTVPTGTVTFFSDGVALGTALLNQGGIAQIANVELAAGIHSLTANYNSGTAVVPSASAPLSITVHGPGLNTTTTTVTSSLNPSPAGTPVVFTIQVNGTRGGVPTGTVTVYLNGKAVGQGTLNNTGSLVFNTGTMLTSGAFSVIVQYNGDGTFVASTSPALVQVVQ